MIMLMNHEGTISTTAAGKASSKEKKSYTWDWLLGHLTKNQKEIQFVMTQNQTSLWNDLKKNSEMTFHFSITYS